MDSNTEKESWLTSYLKFFLFLPSIPLIKSKKKLEEFLGYRFEYLERLLPHVDSFYGESFLPKEDEDGNPRFDTEGKPLMRKVNPSYGELKLIQRRIKNLLNRIKLPHYIHGGTRRKNNVTYAEVHLGKKYHFCTDLKDFFPNITSMRVYLMFIRNGCTPDISRVLTGLTTYRGMLPQGTPTSTHIANLVALTVDSAVNAFCAANNIYYGRFVDDLAFSSMTPFDAQIEELLTIVSRAGFRINYKKTFTKIGKFKTTGIEVGNDGLDVTRKTTRKIENPSTPEKSRKTLEGYRRMVKRRGK